MNAMRTSSIAIGGIIAIAFAFLADRHIWQAEYQDKIDQRDGELLAQKHLIEDMQETRMRDLHLCLRAVDVVERLRADLQECMEVMCSKCQKGE